MAVVVKPILPGPFHPEVFMQEIKKEYDKAANEMLLDFELTAATWKRKVKFTKSVLTTNLGIAINVYTADEIYGYVDKGTKAHVITPKKPGGRLFFMTTGFRPKSTKGSLVSGQGSPAGPPLAVAKVVHHPGTEARGFDKKIAAKWQKRLRERMDPVMKYAAQRSGHYYA